MTRGIGTTDPSHEVFVQIYDLPLHVLFTFYIIHFKPDENVESKTIIRSNFSHFMYIQIIIPDSNIHPNLRHMLK